MTNDAASETVVDPIGSGPIDPGMTAANDRDDVSGQTAPVASKETQDRHSSALAEASANIADLIARISKLEAQLSRIGAAVQPFAEYVHNLKRGRNLIV